MRICLLCYRANPYSGGQGIYLKYIAEEMVRQGHEVHAIVGPPYPFPMKGVVVHKIENNQYYVKKGLSVINPQSPFEIFKPIDFYEFLHSRAGAFPEISSFGYRAYLLLRKLQAQYNFDIIHDNQSIGYGLLLMKSFGIPVTATIHHPLTIDLENYLERAPNFTRKIRTAMFYPVVMQRIVSKLLDHIITVSEDSKRTNNRHFGIPLEKQTVVLNGIDTDVFHIDHGVRKVRGKILFVGNVEDGKKGFQYLLRAMALVKSRVKLVVVDGCSPHRIMTNMLMDRLKLHDRVVFVGKTSIEELVRHYNESEIAVVPSVHEGFGFPAGEAMACGVPVISSDGGALPEVVGDAGIIVPSRDEAVIAHAIDVLADDPGLRHRIGRAGLARVKKLFRWDAAVSQMIGVFERCIKEKTGTV